MTFLKRATTSTSSALFSMDVLALLFAWPLASWLSAPSTGVRPGSEHALLLLLYPAVNLLFLYAMGLYRRDAILETRKSLGRVPLVVGIAAVVTLSTSAILAEIAPFWPEADGGRMRAVQFAIAVVCFSGSAYGARILLSIMLRRRVFRRHLLIVGAGARAWDLVWMLRREGNHPNYEITLVHNPGLGPIDERLVETARDRIIIRDDFKIVDIAAEVGADQIVVAPDERRGMPLESLLDCKRAGFPVVQYLTFVEREIRRVDIKRMELSWILYSEGFQFSIVDRAIKRGFDVFTSALMLIITSPFLAAAAIAIRLEGPGPILYRQERVTLDNRVFWVLKLRTMRVDAEKNGAVWAAKGDDRITRIGGFLRRSRLDEVPQLVNVLRGEMSLVGPRPERPHFVAELAEIIPLYNERHMVKAGLTGWAQINYPYGASIDDARSKLSYDLYYVKNFNIIFDFLILLQTMRVILWPSGPR